MNCAAVRHTLLASERPDRPGPDESDHLRTCPACRDWLARLTRLEQQIRRLPAPDVPPPADLFAWIDQATADPPRLIVPLPSLRTPPPTRSEGARQKLALAFSLAATLALFTLGWWAWPHHTQPADPAGTPVAAADAYQLRRTQRLRQAHTPRERVGVVVDLADECLAEARLLGPRPDAVARLADQYDRLIEWDLVRLAADLPPADRPIVLAPLGERLRRTESEASRLAAEWDAPHAASAASVRRIATTARDADRRLRLLVAVPL